MRKTDTSPEYSVATAVCDEMLTTFIIGAQKRNMTLHVGLATLSLFVGTMICFFSKEGNEKEAFKDFADSLKPIEVDEELCDSMREHFAQLYEKTFKKMTAN